jgi:putative flippase GtrA
MNEVQADSRGTERQDPERHETEAERIDRNLGELLQELRVASIGVQVLLGFLFSIPFTTRFQRLSDQQRTLYVADLLLAALATALLAAPVAYHRLTFRHHVKARLLRTANVLAIAGLTAVALTISGAVLLVVGTLYNGIAVTAIAALTAAVIFGLWFVLPLSQRRRDDY